MKQLLRGVRKIKRLMMINKEQLMQMAQKARKNAYAPYSNYLVGAALLGADDNIYLGCNIENSSYGLTCCAERVAVYAAITANVKKFQALALAGDGKIVPCGACLQVLMEFSPEMQIYIPDGKNGIKTFFLGDFLPMVFDFNPVKGAANER